ncbi:ABC transporter permease subunit [Streptomyces sp. NPDC003077]|uniref:ABC transporter permease n=1 Tax=Streptomyces sp. NPDC003077 TaxID=3154443 RepID=UPI0033B0BEF7
MTSPQQPRPEPRDAAAPAAPSAGPMPPAGAPLPPSQPPTAGQGPAVPPAREPGTMLLQGQAQSANQPPADAGTMFLQAPAAQPQPQSPAPPHAPAPQQNPAPPHPSPANAGHHQHPATAPAQNWQAGYVSPIPVRPAHLGHALASEWTKIKSVRSTMWTLGVMVLITVGIGMMTSLVASSVNMDPLLAPGFVGVLLGSLCVITLGILSISSEYGTGMIRTTLTACPSRARVLTAKAIVFFLLAFVITTIATTLVAFLNRAVLSGPDPTFDQWVRATLGAGLYVALLGLLAMSVGALLRHSAGAISLMMGLVLLPMLLALFLQGGEFTQKIGQALIEYSVPSAMAALYDIPFLETGPSGWQPVVILAGVTAVVLGGAYVALQRRDV